MLLRSSRSAGSNKADASNTKQNIVDLKGEQLSNPVRGGAGQSLYNHSIVEH